ncbi:hypothetical protein IscW_ISCW010056 [Ixodes scapularis]|uniref:Uncharacterized protein n=1 Tax=Ixodes scapularis TaxID=6945 RepID=B7Q1R4_IXOSC|nr:hypothetical protein IscW_ISCW010056 [Ixodes scapularis]|eukprot:XP_002410029.1 hypothetical protein IscW_ISCW010056 [Ixodes scapularis]
MAAAATLASVEQFQQHALSAVPFTGTRPHLIEGLSVAQTGPSYRCLGVGQAERSQLAAAATARPYEARRGAPNSTAATTCP